MDGMSLIIACHCLPFLKMTLWSLEKYSALKNELVIMLDLGAEPRDYTEKWLRERGTPFYTSSFRDPYRTWNLGLTKATREVVCMVPQDLVYAPEWDVNLLKHVTPKTAVLSVVINPEDGAFWGPRVVECNCGDLAKAIRATQCWPRDFDLYKFLDKAEQVKRPNQTDQWEWFNPLAVNRETFLDAEGYCTGEPFPIVHEPETFNKLRNKGVSIVRSLDSVVYHFGSSGIMAKMISAEEGWNYDPWIKYQSLDVNR